MRINQFCIHIFLPLYVFYFVLSIALPHGSPPVEKGSRDFPGRKWPAAGCRWECCPMFSVLIRLKYEREAF